MHFVFLQPIGPCHACGDMLALPQRGTHSCFTKTVDNFAGNAVAFRKALAAASNLLGRLGEMCLMGLCVPQMLICMLKAVHRTVLDQNETFCMHPKL